MRKFAVMAFVIAVLLVIAAGMLVGMVYAYREEKIVAIFKKHYELKLLIALILCEVFHIISSFMQAGIGYYTEWQLKNNYKGI